jgi:hypothetical protein
LRAPAFSVAEYVRAHRWARASLYAMPMMVVMQGPDRVIVMTTAKAKAAAGISFVK